MLQQNIDVQDTVSLDISPNLRESEGQLPGKTVDFNQNLSESEEQLPDETLDLTQT